VLAAAQNGRGAQVRTKESKFSLPSGHHRSLAWDLAVSEITVPEKLRLGCGTLRLPTTHCAARASTTMVRLVAALLLCAAAAAAGWQLSEPRAGEPLHVAGVPFFDALTAATAPVAGYEGTREAVITHAGQEAAARAKVDAALPGGAKPNILIFLLDDIGWGDLGAYGGGAAVGSPTPNMDAAARAGLLLTSAYSQPSCSPTRGSILTGRLPMRHGLLRPPMAGELGGLQGEVTMANVLSNAGYATTGADARCRRARGRAAARAVRGGVSTAVRARE
jgi:hypothetical protein